MLYNNNRGEYMKYTEERKPIINILFFVISMSSLFIMPSVFYTIMRMFFEDSLTLQFLSELFAIVLLFLIYYKDLIKEFKIYIKNFKKNIPIMLKYYILGILIMIVSNLFISMIIGEVSSNESAVRENLFAFPVYTMLSIMIVAPLSEELVFRKSISPYWGLIFFFNNISIIIKYYIIGGKQYADINNRRRIWTSGCCI